MTSKERKRLLVLRLSALGDVAMTIPVVYSAARCHPEIDFYVLTRPFMSRLFINTPENIRIIKADLNREHGGYRGTARLLRELGSYHFHYVADLHNVLRTWVIDRYMKLRGTKVAMVDKMRSRRRALLKHTCASQPQFIDRYLDVFEQLGLPVKLDFDNIFNGEKAPSPILVKSPAVGVAPFARYYNKAYPLNMMKQVVEGLTKRGVNVYLFGARGNEESVLEKWAEEIEGCTNVAGKINLEEELAVMSNLNLMVSMDSANQHLAALAGTEVITIWGSTTPACGFLPYKGDEEHALCAGIDCQPCTIAGSNACGNGDLACFKAVTPKAVIDKVVATLDKDA